MVVVLEEEAKALTLSTAVVGEGERLSKDEASEEEEELVVMEW